MTGLIAHLLRREERVSMASLRAALRVVLEPTPDEEIAALNERLRWDLYPWQRKVTEQRLAALQASRK